MTTSWNRASGRRGLSGSRLADRQRDSQSNLPYCVVTFDIAGLAAGTEYPRPFEERLKEVLNEPMDRRRWTPGHLQKPLVRGAGD